ncbi:MAG: hypothetical protein QME76_10485 [Bacillota bacterium]|nr:hypothetical protein [Bacillota bacterium]
MVQESRAAEDRRCSRQFNALAVVAAAVFAVISLYCGIVFLRHVVFTGYFSPLRHTIVQQDPETLQVLAWKDRAGHVYTRESADVRFFPYGITALMLLVAGLSVEVYRILIGYYETERVVPEAPPNRAAAGYRAPPGGARLAHHAR